MLADLQDFVKGIAAGHHLVVQNSTWGEPVTDPKGGLTTIPMMFTLRGVPADIDFFLRELLHGRRFIRVERASVTKAQDQLQLNIALVAFKRDGAHE